MTICVDKYFLNTNRLFIYLSIYLFIYLFTYLFILLMYMFMFFESFFEYSIGVSAGILSTKTFSVMVVMCLVTTFMVRQADRQTDM